MVEEHLLRQRGAFPQAEKLQHLVLLAGQMHRAPVDLDRLRVQVHRHLAGGDDRLRVALGTADDRVDARDQFLAVERLGHVIVGAEAEAADLVLGVVLAGEDQDRRVDARETQLAQHLVPVHVGQVQIEEDQVVIVELGEIDPLLAEVRGIDVQVRVGEHQFDAPRHVRVVFDEKDSHVGHSLRGLACPADACPAVPRLTAFRFVNARLPAVRNVS